VIYAGVEVSRKEGNKELSVIYVELMVQGTRGNESTERSGVHDEQLRIKDTALQDTTGGCVRKTGRFHTTQKQRAEQQRGRV